MKHISGHDDSIDATLNQPYELFAMMMMLILSPNGLAVEISICADEIYQKNINTILQEIILMLPLQN
jgi:hypothetical protein